MTALPAAKRHALRYRIWCFAHPKGWDVTIAEIAEALAESVARVRGVLVQAAWINRVRANTTRPDRQFANAAQAMGGSLVEDARPIVRDVLAGRIGAENPA